MRRNVRSWYRRRTYHWSRWDTFALARRKAGQTISVVLPARNEQATVGIIVGMLRHSLMEQVPLIDEIVVVDSGSEDRTIEAAGAAGARVVRACDVVPELGDVPGKGEALWKSQFVTSGDLTVFVDSDLVDVGPHYVTGLVGPLLTDPSVSFVKAFYDRPLVTTDNGVQPTGGGRVTELVARPLLNLYWPELAGVVQPLSGEYAGRRTVLEQVPFASGYGVEIGMLVDLLRMIGLPGIAQVDLGHRDHNHQADADLGLMAATIIQTALRRLPQGAPAPRAGTLTQFQRLDTQQQPVVRPVAMRERPPAITVPQYNARRTLVS